MAKNDVVLVDAIVQQRISEALPSNKLDEVFEHLALEQVLKDFDLSRDELERGWIDGRDDGGIDAIFIFINGHLVQDAGTFSWPRTGVVMEIHVFTCKHHATFEQAPIDAILASAQELFDLSISRADLKGSYSQDVLRMRDLLAQSYRRIAIASAKTVFKFHYVSRGDSTIVGSSVLARATQLRELIRTLFSQSDVDFEFVGAGELIALFRRTKQFSLELPFVEHVSAGAGSYMVLARLREYWRFVSDENGNLRRYLFDSNVRDFLRGTRVNDDIADSLRAESGPDFWWLNNGVTILATKAALSGKTLSLQDIQIVNGLQTTETIYRHFGEAAGSPDERMLLVKILVSTDPSVRDKIIRATNNQNAVELASLHATDKIQRDIEDILEKNEWFYERRKNYYRNIGKPAQRFVTPLYLASGVLSLVFKNPAAAARLRNRFMRNQLSYDAVFSEKLNLQIWPTLVTVLKTVDDGLSLLRSQTNELGDRFLAKWRGLVALICTARLLGKFDYSTDEFLSIRPAEITATFVAEVWRPIEEAALIPSSRRAFKSPHFAFAQCSAAAGNYSLTGVEVVGRRHLPVAEGPSDPVFLEEVRKILAQGNPNPELAAAAILGCDPKLARAAIRILRAKQDKSALPNLPLS
jgi:AIPR protein